MKLVAVKFDDAVDVSAFIAGQGGVTVSNGINTIAGGTVVFAAPVYEPPPEVVPHDHPASTDVGPSQPI